MPTVVLLVHGRPVSFDVEPSSNSGGHASLLDFPNFRALVAGWRPAEEGGTALVNLLRGRMATGGGGPSGRLAQAWPRSVGQVGGPASPWFQQRNGKWISNHRGEVDPVDGFYHYDPYVDAPSTPLFEFGAGMSFSSVAYVKDSASAEATRGQTVTVDVMVRNTGGVDAAEVVMVFVTAPLDNVVRYWKRLAGFTKVLLPAGGGNMRVSVTIDTDDLAVYATTTPGAPGAGARTLLKGVYNVSIGGSSATDFETTTFTL